MITNLATVLRNAGCTVVEIPGWKTRKRPGAFKPVGVMWHHTGGSANGKSYAEWMAKTGRADLPAPLCQLSIDRQGVCYVSAAGRSNHAGAARARGSVAAGDGNSLYIGIEFHHTGTETWTAVQYNAGIRATAAILRQITKTSERTVAGHYETSTTGKWDPGDPNGVRFKDKRVLDMDKVRRNVAEAMKGSGTVQAQRGNNVTSARGRVERAIQDLNRAVNNGRGVKVQRGRQALQDALRILPKR